jgi:hypothetical protein
MSEFKNMENELDPRLQGMLKAYAVRAERDPNTARHNQERFVAILNMIFEEPVQSQSATGWLSPAAWTSALRHPKQTIAKSTRIHTILFASMALLVLLLFLFGGMGVTAYAASSSLPGDTLYSFKTTMEQARAGLTVDPDSQVRLYLTFAARRLSEIQALIRAGRYDDIHQAASEFEKDLQKSLNAIDRLSQTDHARAIGLSAETITILQSYENILTPMLVSVPAEAQAAIQAAIDSARSTAITLDVRYDDFNEDGEMDDKDSTTPTPLAGELPPMTETPQPSQQSSDVLDVTVMPTPLPPVVEVPPTPAPPVPTATQAQPLQANAGDCQGFIGALTVENVYVPPGASCVLEGTTVTGNIKVDSAASLTARQVTVLGNIQADGASAVEVLAGSTVGGSVQLKSGGSVHVENVIINGDIQLELNNGALSATGNQVGGNLQVFQNGGNATITNNTISGNLQCKENNPAPVGGNNQVQGTKEDQCAGL